MGSTSIMQPLKGLWPQKLLVTAIFGGLLSACGGGNKIVTPPNEVGNGGSSSLSVSQQSSSNSVASTSSIPAAVSSSPIQSSSVQTSSIQTSSSVTVISSSSEAPIFSSSVSSSVISSSSEPVNVSSSSSSVSAEVGGPSILWSSGQFDNGAEFFEVLVDQGDTSTDADDNVANVSYNGEVVIDISRIPAMPVPWGIQLRHDVAVVKDETYTLCFSAKADNSRTVGVDVDNGPDGGFESVIDLISSSHDLSPVLTTSYEQYTYTFTSKFDDETARLTVNLGTETVKTYFDDIGLYVGTACGLPGGLETPTGSGSANITGLDSDSQTTLPSITTAGNQVLFGGQKGSVAGMSLFWSNNGWGAEDFYNASAVKFVKDNWKANLIRPAMGVEESGAYLSDRTGNQNRLETVVRAAIENNMYVIIDWHTHHAEDHKSEAIEFFKDMATKFGDSPNVIYEIYNEPIDSSWSNDIKPYALDVITEIRKIDPDNLIIVGTPFYSAHVDDAAVDPITAQDFPQNGDYANNIAYTLHFYAAEHLGPNRSRMIRALNAGIPLFVTEWGAVNADGNGAVNVVEADFWLDLLHDYNISHANWAFHDKNEGSSALRPDPNANRTGDWTDNDLTDSGRYVREQIRNW